MQRNVRKYNRCAPKDVFKIAKGDESWIYAYEPDSKQQSLVWIFEVETNLMKIVCGRSTSKEVIASFFCLRSDCSTRIFF